MKLSTQTILLVLCIFAIVFLATDKYYNHKKINQLQRNTEILANDYQFTVSKKDSQIVYQEQVIVDKNSKLAKLGDSLQHIKNIKSQVRIVTVTQYDVDTVKIPNDNITTIDTINYLKLPYTLSKSTKWYNYKFRFTHNGEIIRDSLSFVSDFIVLSGYEKKFNLNPFNKNKPIIYFRDKNPHTKVTQMQNVVVSDFKPRRATIGIQVGYGVTNQGLSPYIGLGIGYTLLQF